MYIENTEIREAYTEDTKGRKYHAPIVTKNDGFIPTKKEAEKHNGKIVEANTNERIHRLVFFKLSDDVKRMYITGLREKYNAIDKQICEAIGCDTSYMSRLTKHLGIALKRKRLTQTREQAIAWKAFMRGIPSIEPVEEPVAETLEPVMVANEPPKPEPVPTYTSPCTFVSFEQEGKLNVEELARRISALFPDGTDCRVLIRIDTEHVLGKEFNK